MSHPRIEDASRPLHGKATIWRSPGAQCPGDDGGEPVAHGGGSAEPRRRPEPVGEVRVDSAADHHHRHVDGDGQPERAQLRRARSRIPAEGGLVAVVAVLLGSTAYDSWRDTATWIRFLQGSNISSTVWGTIGLLVAVAIVGVTFAAASMATGVGGVDRRQLPRRLAHSVVPIIVGYMVAHYLSFFIQTGQLTLIQLSDPMGVGADLFGTADWEVNYWLAQHPTFLATTKVLAIVAGHVLGVIAAHDRALEVLPKKHQVTGQLPLLLAMVLYTFMGLFLLFGA